MIAGEEIVLVPPPSHTWLLVPATPGLSCVSESQERTSFLLPVGHRSDHRPTGPPHGEQENDDASSWTSAGIERKYDSHPQANAQVHRLFRGASTVEVLAPLNKSTKSTRFRSGSSRFPHALVMRLCYCYCHYHHQHHHH